MKESYFIKLNRDKWQNYEKIQKNPSSITVDKLADTYIDITTDLSYSQSKFGNTKITAYLNTLASGIHHSIYKNKKEKRERFSTFWKQEVPQSMASTQRSMFVAFVIFFLSVIIGCFSTAVDDTFVRFILGDDYVEMTLRNIANGDPMGVYGSQSSEAMFFTITINNVRVAFITFAFGVFTSIGSSYMLVTNGVMLGTFQYFFYQKGLLLDSSSTIWIHGTLEISAIIIAGGAGIHMGNGWLFPKTYSRLASFRRSAKTGMKIVIGLVPVFIIAAFLESYITRHTEFSIYLKGAIILISFLFILFYFVYLPIKIKKHESNFNPNRILQTT